MKIPFKVGIFFATVVVVTGVVREAVVVRNNTHQIGSLGTQVKTLEKKLGEAVREKEFAIEILAKKRESRQTETTTLSSAAEADVHRFVNAIRSLREQLGKKPEENIPEIQFLKEDDWIELVTSLSGLENGLSSLFSGRALHLVRSTARSRASGKIWKALQTFVTDSSGKLPADAGELAPFIDHPAAKELLARYEMVRTGIAASVPPGGIVIREKSGLVKNPDLDALYDIGLDRTQMRKRD